MIRFAAKTKHHYTWPALSHLGEFLCPANNGSRQRRAGFGRNYSYCIERMYFPLCLRTLFLLLCFAFLNYSHWKTSSPGQHDSYIYQIMVCFHWDKFSTLDLVLSTLDSRLSTKKQTRYTSLTRKFRKFKWKRLSFNSLKVTLIWLAKWFQRAFWAIIAGNTGKVNYLKRWLNSDCNVINSNQSQRPQPAEPVNLFI